MQSEAWYTDLANVNLRFTSVYGTLTLLLFEKRKNVYSVLDLLQK